MRDCSTEPRGYFSRIGDVRIAAGITGNGKVALVLLRDKESRKGKTGGVDLVISRDVAMGIIDALRTVTKEPASA